MLLLADRAVRFMSASPKKEDALLLSSVENHNQTCADQAQSSINPTCCSMTRHIRFCLPVAGAWLEFRESQRLVTLAGHGKYALVSTAGASWVGIV